jgi:hypothetical protein
VLSATLPSESGGAPQPETHVLSAKNDAENTASDAEMALCIFPKDGAVRIALKKLIGKPFFDQFILFVIMYNTILMIVTDFSKFDPTTGDIVGKGSPENTIVIASEMPLLLIFTVEFLIKAIAMGFWTGKGAYIKDNWNKLDFVVVIAGWLENIPSFPNLTMLRCFRVLRPLRSISRLPNLKLQVNLIIRSVTELGNVICLLVAFIFFLALVGLQLWGVSGTLHGRCRLTPFPVRYSHKGIEFPIDNVGMAAAFDQNLTGTNRVVRCSDKPSNYIIPASPKPFDWEFHFEDEWTPQDCAWPIASGNQGCSLEEYGGYKCPLNQWCGSNYDSYGRHRFSNLKIMKSDEYNERYNWGWTGFDHIGTSFLALFQSTTLEGWSDIMYIIQDGYQPDFGAFFFIFATLTGSFFMLNLALAIVFSVMVNIHEEEADAAVHKMLEKFFQEMDSDHNGVVTLGEMSETKFYKRLAISSAQMTQLFDAIDVNKNGTLEYDEFFNFSIEAFDNDVISLAKSLKAQSTEKFEDQSELIAPWLLKHVAALRPLALSSNFDLFIVIMIFANIIVLALDRYPMPISETAELEVASMVLTLIFAGELIIKLLGMGIYHYFLDNFNTFDAFVTTTSLVELCIIPPSFDFADAPSSMIYAGDIVTSGGAGISVLRLCRLFRLLKLITKFDSLREIAATVIAMVPAVGNFCLLIIIFLVIMALFGSQIIANRLRFDSVGYPLNYWENLTPGLEDVPNAAWLNATNTPTNFDDFIGSFFAVFQVMTGEDWNVVFYDAMRGEGPFGGCFVLFSLLLGSLLLLNTFVAVMLDEFEQARKRFELINKASTKERLTKVRENMTTNRRPSSYYEDMIVDSSDEEGDGLASGMSLGEGLFTFEILLPKKGETDKTLTRMERRSAAKHTFDDDCNLGFSIEICNQDIEQFRHRLVVQTLDPRSDAAHAGLREGDLIWHIDGEDVKASNDDEVFDVESRLFTTQNQVRLLVVRDEHVHRGAGVELGILLHGNNDERAHLHNTYEETKAPTKAPTYIKNPRFANISTEVIYLGSNSKLDLNSTYEETEVARKKRKKSSSLDMDGGDNIDGEGGSPPGQVALEASSANADDPEHWKAAVAEHSNIPEGAEHGANEYAVDMIQSEGAGGEAAASIECNPGEEPWAHPHAWRNKFLNIVVNRYFKGFIFGLIIVSSLCLTWDNPLNNPEAQLYKTMKVVDTIFTTLFIIEMVLKVLALGFVCGKRAYIRDPWNQLDFTVVVISVVLLFSDSGPLKSLRALRCLRALRALRLLSRFPEMKAMVNALFLSLPNVGYVCMFIAMIFLLFAILSINFLKGTFYACQGPSFDSLSLEQTELVIHPKLYNDLSASAKLWGAALNPGGPFAATGYPGSTSHAVCDWLGAEWSDTIPENFNNIGSAMLTLFEICTTEGWVLVMRSSMDSVGIDMQPIENNSRAMCLLYFAFMMVCAIFMVNLFVGVLVDNFVKLREEGGGQSVLLTDAQHAYLELQRYFLLVTKGTGVEDALDDMANPQVHRPGNIAWEVSANKGKHKNRADSFIYACITTNVILLATEHLGQSKDYSHFLEVANFTFAVIFTLEAIVKVAGITFCSYWEDHWNKFDFFLVVACDIGLVIAFAGAGVNLSGMFQMLRIFRVARMMRVIRTMQGLKALLKTIVLMIPYLGNIATLMFIVFFIYAVMGMQLFAKIATDGQENLDHRANFQSFAQAMVTLWRCATGEFWNGIMHDLASDRIGCIEDPQFDKAMCGFKSRGSAGHQDCVPLNGCGTPISYVYFCSFCLIVTFVFVNLFITTILETFDKSTEDIARENRLRNKLEKNKDRSGFSRRQTVHFCREWNKAWKRYATALAEETDISIGDVPRTQMGGEFFFDFMCAMNPPMGLAARRGAVGTFGEQISDQDIWKRLELISVFPKQIEHRSSSLTRSDSERPAQVPSRRTSFRNAVASSPPMPPLDLLIYEFDDAVMVRCSRPASIRDTHAHSIRVFVIPQGCTYLMLMWESKVMEVLDQIEEGATAVMRETAWSLHKHRKHKAIGRDPGELRLRMLVDAGLTGTEDDILNVSRAYQQHKLALDTPVTPVEVSPAASSSRHPFPYSQRVLFAAEPKKTPGG